MLPNQDTQGLTRYKVGRVQHGTEVHFVPDICCSAGIGVAIHLRDPGLVSRVDRV